MRASIRATSKSPSHTAIASISVGLCGRRISLSLSKMHMAFPAILIREEQKREMADTISLA